jgi:hypothetical protein
MKNYFFGINRNVHMLSISREKNLFINDNKMRFDATISSTTPTFQPREISNFGQGVSSGGTQRAAQGSGFTPNGQSIESSMTTRLKGSDGLEANINKIREMTANDPFAKLSPQAFNALASGKDVQLQIQQTAPERRNLFIGAFVTALQLMGGAGGAAYSDELGAYMKDRASKDAEFVSKHGNNYKMNIFGGAEARETYITATVIENEPTNPVAQRENAKKVDADINARIIEAQKSQPTSDPKRMNMDVAIQARSTADYGYVQQNRGNFLTGSKGDSTSNATNLAFDTLRDVYGKGGAVSKGKDSNQTVTSVFIYGQKGENYLGDINTLKGNGKSNEQNAEILRQRQQAAKDYLALGVSAGVITQQQLDQAGNDPAKLVELFKSTEQTLKNRYGEMSGTVKDGFLGAHHMMMMQRALNDQIQYNQGGAFALTAIANEITDPSNQLGGNAQSSIEAKAKETSVQVIASINAGRKAEDEGRVARGQAPLGPLTAEEEKAVVSRIETDMKRSALEATAQSPEMIAQIRSMSAKDVSTAFDALKSDIKGGKTSLLATGAQSIMDRNQKIADTVATTAKGVYGKNNPELERNLADISGKFAPQLTRLKDAANKGEITAPTVTGGTSAPSIEETDKLLAAEISRVSTDVANINSGNQSATKEVAFISDDKENAVLNNLALGLKSSLQAQGVTSIQFGNQTVNVSDINGDTIKKIAAAKAADPSIAITAGGKQNSNLDNLVGLAISIDKTQAASQSTFDALERNFIERSALSIASGAGSLGQANRANGTGTAAQGLAAIDGVTSGTSATGGAANGSTSGTQASGASTTPSKSSQQTEFLSSRPGVPALKNSEIETDDKKKAIKEALKGLANLGDLFTSKFLEIADKILNKAFADAEADGVFSYGFSGASNGRITSRDQNELQKIYSNMRDVGGTKDPNTGTFVGGFAGGINKVKEYNDRREKEALNPTIRLDEALNKAVEQTKGNVSGDLDKLQGLVSDPGAFKVQDSTDAYANAKNKIDFLERNSGATQDEIKALRDRLSGLGAQGDNRFKQVTDPLNSDINRGFAELSKKLESGGAKVDPKLEALREEYKNSTKLLDNGLKQEYIAKLKEIKEKVEELKKASGIVQEPVAAPTGSEQKKES